MYKTERGITLKFGIYNNTNGIEVVNLIKCFVLRIHLTIKAIYRLYSALKIEVDIVFLKLFRKNSLCVLNKVTASAKLLLNLKMNLVITNSVEVIKADVLKLLLNTLNTEAVCQGSVNIHGLESDCTLTILLLCRKSTHVVKSVTKLDEDNTNILVHGEKHLTNVLNMSLFLICHLNLNNLGKAVNKHSNVTAKHLRKYIKISFICAILHGVMKKCRTNRIGIKTKLCNDCCNSHGMADIRLTAKAHLSLVELIGIIICLGYTCKVIISLALLKIVKKGCHLFIHNSTFICRLCSSVSVSDEEALTCQASSL